MQKVMYVPDLAGYLGMTESSIRTHLSRCNWNAVPPPIRLGGRIAWIRDDVDDFLQQKSAQANKIKKNGNRSRKSGSSTQ